MTEKTWSQLIEERIQADIHEAVDAWKKGASIELGTSYEDGNEGRLIVELDLGDCGDEFPLDERVRANLADLLRVMIRLTAMHWIGDGGPPDADLLAATIPSHHVTEQRKLKMAQDLLRIVLEYEATLD
jgi:hypothetical protein